MKEFQIIEEFFKPLTNNCDAAQGLLDDVAKIEIAKGEELLVSKDLFVEDVHFLMTDGGFKIASKLLCTNLSDIAASGGKPLYYMLGFSKNKNIDRKFVSEFSRGLKFIQDKFGVSLIGGDAVSSKEIFFSVTIFGSAKNGKSLQRAGAKDGDLIFVSGNIGDAFLGRKILSQKKEARKAFTDKDLEKICERHFFPFPRILLGQELLKNNLSKCAIDVSDGLFADLLHICEASKLSAQINIDQIPISKFAEEFLKNNSDIVLSDLLAGGDDYELIFSCDPKNEKKIFDLSKKINLKLSCIGKFVEQSSASSKINLFDKNLKKIKIKNFGYEH